MVVIWNQIGILKPLFLFSFSSKTVTNLWSSIHSLVGGAGGNREMLGEGYKLSVQRWITSEGLFITQCL